MNQSNLRGKGPHKRTGGRQPKGSSQKQASKWVNKSESQTASKSTPEIPPTLYFSVPDDWESVTPQSLFTPVSGQATPLGPDQLIEAVEKAKHKNLIAAKTKPKYVYVEKTHPTPKPHHNIDKPVKTRRKMDDDIQYDDYETLMTYDERPPPTQSLNDIINSYSAVCKNLTLAEQFSIGTGAFDHLPRDRKALVLKMVSYEADLESFKHQQPEILKNDLIQTARKSREDYRNEQIKLGKDPEHFIEKINDPSRYRPATPVPMNPLDPNFKKPLFDVPRPPKFPTPEEKKTKQPFIKQPNTYKENSHRDPGNNTPHSSRNNKPNDEKPKGKHNHEPPVQPNENPKGKRNHEPPVPPPITINFVPPPANPPPNRPVVPDEGDNFQSPDVIFVGDKNPVITDYLPMIIRIYGCFQGLYWIYQKLTTWKLTERDCFTIFFGNNMSYDLIKKMMEFGSKWELILTWCKLVFGSPWVLYFLAKYFTRHVVCRTTLNKTEDNPDMTLRHQQNRLTQQVPTSYAKYEYKHEYVGKGSIILKPLNHIIPLIENIDEYVDPVMDTPKVEIVNQELLQSIMTPKNVSGHIQLDTVFQNIERTAHNRTETTMMINDNTNLICTTRSTINVCKYIALNSRKQVENLPFTLAPVQSDINTATVYSNFRATGGQRYPTLLNTISRAGSRVKSYPDSEDPWQFGEVLAYTIMGLFFLILTSATLWEQFAQKLKDRQWIFLLRGKVLNRYAFSILCHQQAQKLFSPQAIEHLKQQKFTHNLNKVLDQLFSQDSIYFLKFLASKQLDVQQLAHILKTRFNNNELYLNLQRRDLIMRRQAFLTATDPRTPEERAAARETLRNLRPIAV